MEVVGHLAELVARLRELQNGEVEEGAVVGLEVNLAAHFQCPAVGRQEATVGQTALGLPLGGPGVAEVDVDEIHLVLGEVVGDQGGVAHHEEDVLQLQSHGPLHGDDHGVGDLLNGDEEDVRVLLGGLHGEAALAAAQLQPQLPGRRHERLLPLAPQGKAVLDLDGSAFLHSGEKVFLFSHPHGDTSLFLAASGGGGFFGFKHSACRKTSGASSRDDSPIAGWVGTRDASHRQPRGFRPRTPGYFPHAGKVTKGALRRGTLSIVSNLERPH